MKFLYDLIDSIDDVGNIFIDTFLDKLYLLKIIFFDYFIRENWIINLGILMIISYSTDNNLIGAMLGALLTFNLINGYSFYTKVMKWKKIKKTLLASLYDFIVWYSLYLQIHRFPLERKNLLDEHFTLDSENDLKRLETPFTQSYITVFSSYETVLQKYKLDNTLKINEQALNLFFDFLKISSGNIKNDLILSMTFFNDKIDFFIHPQALISQLIKMDQQYGKNFYMNEPRCFIVDNLELINKIKHILLELDQ